MRLPGVVLFLLGLLGLVVGTFHGFGSLFSWNGRHPIDTVTLDEATMHPSFTPAAGYRYTLSVAVVFDREGLARRDGVIAFDAQLPLVVRVKDSAGTSLAETTGWLDPSSPPNVLYGQAAHESTRGPMPELVVERLVGPFTAATTAPLAVEVHLGPDRVGQARILTRRLVIYDDALPPAIRNGIVVALAGAVAFFAGVFLLLLGFLQRRRSRARVLERRRGEEDLKRKRRGDNRSSDVV